ncbi:MAG: ABC transporter ATP-binding protein [Candidatus Aceula meridiana]|nr:ABC transporter ATP-binding protein [Candidatus Aceula meridiana]
MSSNAPIIEFKNIWKKYSRSRIFHKSLREDIANIFQFKKNKDLSSDEFWALKKINLTIAQGETLGFYGPNGAGKSTILKLIAGVTYPTKGTIKAEGRIAPLLEIGAGFHKDLTGRENIFINGAILGMKIPEIKNLLDLIIDFSEIQEFIDMPVKKYSSGMYLRLAFSIAIHSQADIYLIDEIIAVGDEDFKRKCLAKMNELKTKGKTLLLVTHDLSLMQQLADRIIFLNKSEISHQEEIL